MQEDRLEIVRLLLSPASDSATTPNRLMFMLQVEHRAAKFGVPADVLLRAPEMSTNA